MDCFFLKTQGFYMINLGLINCKDAIQEMNDHTKKLVKLP